MFDPTVIEAIVYAVLTLLGIGAGAGIRRPGHSADVAKQLTINTTKLTELVTRLDSVVMKHLERHDASIKALEVGESQLKADVENISDSVELLVAHVGDELPPAASSSITAKLQRARRHDVVTGI